MLLVEGDSDPELAEDCVELGGVTGSCGVCVLVCGCVGCNAVGRPGRRTKEEEGEVSAVLECERARENGDLD